MKKIGLLILTALLFVTTPASGDEGMWLLPLLEKMNIKKMQDLGCKLSAEDIYSINNSSLKDAIVQFGGGCTAEIISPEGLLVTNHHCGYGSIQNLSSIEHNYLEDGYWAMNRSEELPAEGLSVTFLEKIKDVTAIIVKAQKKYSTQKEKDSIFKSISSDLVFKAINNNKNLKARVHSMYGGNAFYLIVTKTYNDIRFVGAPPSSIGKFGADTDNWMWPRHTCDFSMFRVYADKDNNPADYSPDNVPYKAKKHLTISLKGVNPNDFTMIIGYPGRTNRFMTSSELDETIATNTIKVYVRGVRQKIMMENMLADPKVKIQYASKYSGSSNGWKKYMGMNETFEKLNVKERRIAEEKAFKEWVDQKSSRIKKYGKAIEQITTAVENRKNLNCIYAFLTESVGRIEICQIAEEINSIISDSKAVNPDKVKEIEESLDSFYTDYSVKTDKKIAKEMIKICMDNVPPEYFPTTFNEINTKFKGDINAYVDYVFDNSIFTSKEKAEQSIKKTISNIQAEGRDESVPAKNYVAEDPAFQWNNSISKPIRTLSLELRKQGITYAEGKKAFIGGQLEMRKGQAIYPDANSTMRLTYGTVIPYSPKDAVVYNYYTTLDGVMQKEDPNNWEFVVPEKLKQLYASKDFGKYAMPNGKMPACFITNSDITGGNSGSPVMNANGELIGLAFDGNWEAMSGDIIFEPTLQRCINVDIRYVLFIVDKFGGAGYLLNEMTIME